jgi:hypothetical protein
MKQTKKILLLSFSLLLIFLTASCEKDFEETEKTINNSSVSINNLKINTLTEKQAKQKLDSLNLPFSSFNSKLNLVGRSGNSEGTILYDQVTEIIDQNGLQNITYKVIHPLTTSFRFYNLVISSDGVSTTAKLKEFIMTPTFHNKLVSNLSTMDDFEGVVNTRTVYTNNPCPEKDINVVVANNENGTSSTDWVNGFPNGSNTNFWGIFFSGSYVGTGVSNGSGSGNDVPVLTQGEGFFNHLNTFLISVGSALVEVGETIEDAATNLWSWIRRIFRGGCDCPSRVSLRQADNSLVLILNPEDPNLDTTTFDDLPCPELGNTNFAILIASDQNNNIASVSLATHTWWNETATTIQKNALLNFLSIKGYTAKNFQFIDNLAQLSQTHNVNIDAITKFVLTLNAQQYSWFTNQNDFNQHDFSAVNQIAIFVSNNTVNNTISNENLSLANQLINYIITNSSVSLAEQFIIELLQLANNENDKLLSSKLINLTLLTKQNGYFENPFDSNYYSLINPYTEVDTQAYSPLWNVYFSIQCAIARSKLSQEPGWNDLHPWLQNARVYWDASKEMIHLGLDILGLVPAVGEIADITNGIIYSIEGDGVNASLSYASAIPIAGWFSAGVKFAKRADGLNFLVKGTNNLISFGAYNSTKFRAACGIAVGDATKQAHHLIPRGSQIIEHEVVQRAAKATTNQGFHIDQALNGVAVATWRNQPNHPNYNSRIYNKLQTYIQQNPNATPTQCYNQLMIILNQAKQAVINNPNTHLNDLIF